MEKDPAFLIISLEIENEKNRFKILNIGDRPAVGIGVYLLEAIGSEGQNELNYRDIKEHNLYQIPKLAPNEEHSFTVYFKPAAKLVSTNSIYYVNYTDTNGINRSSYLSTPDTDGYSKVAMVNFSRKYFTEPTRFNEINSAKELKHIDIFNKILRSAS